MDQKGSCGMQRGMNGDRSARLVTYSGDMEALGGVSRENARTRPTRRARGHIEKLKSGSLRVKVYAGQDRLLHKPLYLHETVPAGPSAEETWARAEQLRAEFLEKIRSGSHPRSDATVDQLMAEYLENNKKLGRKTRDGYRGNNRKHISPFLGHFKINGNNLDDELVDDFYAELERCRDHCDGSRSRSADKHWSPQAHRCDQRCKPHVCTPSAAHGEGSRVDHRRGVERHLLRTGCLVRDHYRRPAR